MNRRTFLKSSRGVLVAAALSSSKTNAVTADDAQPSSTQSQNLNSSEPLPSPRKRLSLDFGWRFHFGHADNADKDFGLGARRRESQFAKSGNFLRVGRLNFDDGSRSRIAADGEDVSVVTVGVADSRDRLVPTALNEVTFKITRPGRLIGLGNGDRSCHEPDKPASQIEGRQSAFNGLCMGIVQSLRRAGEIRVETSSSGLSPAEVIIQSETTKLRPIAD
jgi:hypothetical protein